MKSLKELLKDLDYKSSCDLSGIRVQGIKCDSRLIDKGDIFVAIKGAVHDGHYFIDEAAGRGASAVVASANFRRADCKVRLAKVADTSKALAVLARNYYNDPSKRIKIIGITGTNGKTTVSYLIENILSAAGRKAGRIGTIDYRIGEKVIEAVNTTPSSLLLNQLLDEMVDRSLDYAVTEVSSHALAQYRIDEILFSTAVFTNISPEHLDYHKTFRQYLNAKIKLFSGLNPEAGAVLNADDPQFENFKRATSSKKTLKFGVRENADVKARDLKMDTEGCRFFVDTKSASFSISSNLIGRFNVSNILAAAGAAVMEGIDPDSIKKGVENLKQVPGRLQPIETKENFRVFIDYAHTDDALGEVLNTLNMIKKNRLIVVFGCGGQRDRLKRPRMGRVAAGLADYAIITSDNPRHEDPELIVEDIKRGIEEGRRNYEVILSRKDAIQKALYLAKDGDTLLIAGKGHEKHQIIGDKKIPFSDEEAVRGILKIPNSMRQIPNKLQIPMAK